MPNNTRYIALSLDTLAVKLDRFSNPPRRSDVTQGGTSYSLIGTPIDSGQQYEPPALWELSASLSIEEYAQLRAMYELQDRRRRNLVAYAIRIHDTILPYFETRTVATRAIVPTFTATSIAGVGLRYPAQWNGRILTLQPTIIGNTKRVLVDLTISELDRVLPP